MSMVSLILYYSNFHLKMEINFWLLVKKDHHIRKFKFEKSTAYDYVKALGFKPQGAQIMQNPIDNTTELLIGAEQLSGKVIKVWKYYQNQTIPAFTDSFEIVVENFQFQKFRALHVKNNGILIILVGTNGRTLKAIYKDFIDSSSEYQVKMYEISAQNEMLGKDVVFINDLHCTFVNPHITYNWECTFQGANNKIFYVSGLFRVTREPAQSVKFDSDLFIRKKKYQKERNSNSKIKSIKFTVNADSFYTPGEYKDAQCRTSFKLIICTFNLSINKEKSKFRITEVIYTKRNSSYGNGNGYSRKMYSQIDKSQLFDPHTVQVTGYWQDCYHTINETVSDLDSVSRFGNNNFSIDSKVNFEDETMRKYQIIRKYRTPEMILNYTFNSNEGGKNPLKLLADLDLKIYLNQISGQLIELKQGNFKNFIYPNTPNFHIAFGIILVGGLFLATTYTLFFRKFSSDLALKRKIEREDRREQRRLMEQQMREFREQQYLLHNEGDNDLGVEEEKASESE